MRRGKRMPRPRRALAVSLGLTLVLSVSATLEAQTRRGVQQRNERRAGQVDRSARDQAATDRALEQRQGQVLLDRFAQRVGEALHLDDATAERLLRELQESRSQRSGINAQVAANRVELGRLIQEAPADEDRIGRLIDEVFALEVQRAQVALDEQRRLSEFLTPLQRARIIWLQQRLARQALERRSGSPNP